MIEANTQAHKEHNISMYSREKLDIDGVVDVLDFDTSCVNVMTSMGMLSIEGTDIKIISLSKDTGKIFIEGHIDALFYSDAAEQKKNGFFRRRG
ncbi:MAG: YabP/YqfC family sporulation protein [Clostridia bacterium]|nr:YabP/YqfC family sporulation protein [Clostridia bacterium]